MVEVKTIRVTLRANKCYINGKEAKELTINGRSPGCRGPKFMNKNKTIIVKIATYGGSQQCLNECKIWNKLKAKDRKYFAPILASGTSKWNGSRRTWCAMEFIPGLCPAIEKQENKWHSVINKLANKYRLDDIHEYNWKVCSRRKHLVIFDYGL